MSADRLLPMYVHPGPKFSCRKPDIGYTIICLKCSSLKILSVVYEGESSKNADARGKKHVQELKAGLRINAMIIHNIAHHESPTENNFQMRVMKIVSRALD